MAKEETIKERLARLEETDKFYGETLAEIKEGILRIENHLKSLPCREATLRLDNLEKTVDEDHEPRIKTVENFKSEAVGKRMIIGAMLVFGSNLITGLIVAWSAGLFE